MNRLKLHWSVVPVALAVVMAAITFSFAVAQDDSENATPDGEHVYRLYCQACHMADGQGAEGAGRYPALADNPAVEVTTDLLLLRIFQGFGAMPAFRNLDDAEIAAVINYVRGSLNDSEEEIDAEFVSDRR